MMSIGHPKKLILNSPGGMFLEFLWWFVGRNWRSIKRTTPDGHSGGTHGSQPETGILRGPHLFFNNQKWRCLNRLFCSYAPSGGIECQRSCCLYFISSGRFVGNIISGTTASKSVFLIQFNSPFERVETVVVLCLLLSFDQSVDLRLNKCI